jgi:o-succinylbenzoate synthase
MLIWRSANPISPDSRASLRHLDHMHITDIQWQTYSVPFLRAFQTAHGNLQMREGILVQVTTNEGITGLGEIAPLPSFNGESLKEASFSLSELAARLRYTAIEEALELLATERISSKNAPTLCGMEIALLDAMGKATGSSVSKLLSPPDFMPRASVPVNVVISAKEAKAAAKAAQKARMNGYCCVKLKVGLGSGISEEVERIAAVRDAIGASMHLRLDANEAWQLEEAIAILSQCVPYDIQYVEQPLKAQDLAGMHFLRKEVPIPIAADESIHDFESVHVVLDEEAADILILKPQFAGGLRNVQQMIQDALEHGVSSVITSTLEAGIGIAAELHLTAATPSITLECGLATLPLLADDLIKEGLPVHDGFMAVPTGPGLGVELDRPVLNKYARRVLL